ncbi:GntR family transcriptional regulator [Rhodobacteraceae bacterium 2376]|uniref:GntR family transcriptional regulator n=1 Tax=Rhabdonatronobacter sediminivivens TaxID=2743469 RepID=A0A7Z0HZA2_9RHOB|nr:GntR family transcriptional regulator [Rhabdonatronobacter sediminivivens]NYS25047.1 GntR family transcriptional regulator [Rhabdonatronobacter sediminivivens]
MARSLPAHQIAYARLRDMVLFGHLAPGDAVTIEGLVERLDLGMTPVREALRRLIAEGALTLQGNRRVSVPRLDPQALADLGFARSAIESQLAVQALPCVSDALIADLRAIDAEVDAAIAAGDVPGYLRCNHRFHFTLYAAAGSEVLEALARSLWLRVGPSLRAVCTGPLGITLPDNHKLALDALVSGDPAALAGAIRADVQQGVDQIRAGMAAGLFDGGAARKI